MYGCPWYFQVAQGEKNVLNWGSLVKRWNTYIVLVQWLRVAIIWIDYLRMSSLQWWWLGNPLSSNELWQLFIHSFAQSSLSCRNCLLTNGSPPPDSLASILCSQWNHYLYCPASSQDFFLACTSLFLIFDLKDSWIFALTVLKRWISPSLVLVLHLRVDVYLVSNSTSLCSHSLPQLFAAFSRSS